jgi:hypothetical protein
MELKSLARSSPSAKSTVSTSGSEEAKALVQKRAAFVRRCGMAR